MTNKTIIQIIEGLQEFQWNNPDEVKTLINELEDHKEFLLDQEENNPITHINFLENHIQKEIVSVIIEKLNIHLTRLNG